MKLENLYASFEVQEIVREPYSGRAFPGFEEIDLSFEELETIMRTHASTRVRTRLGLAVGSIR